MKDLMNAPGVVLNSILILTSKEEHAKRDRQTLKLFRPRGITQLSKGSEALQYLSQNRVDMVLLDSQLDDMDGNKFLKLMSLNQNMKGIPVVMVTVEGHRNKVLDAISAGCSGYILRPYSQDTFKRHVERATHIERMVEVEELQLREAKEMITTGNFDDAIEAFEEIVSEQNQAQKYYDMGLKHLMKHKYGQAIIAFKKAVKINDLFAEAYKGLSEAYKGKGDLENCKRCLQKAAEVYAQFDRLEDCKQAFIEILKYDSLSPNPFNTLGVKLRKAGDIAGALHAYKQAVELTPEDENIHFNMSKAYYFMGDLGRAQASIVSALEINPYFEEGRQLYKSISGNEYAKADPALRDASLESKKAAQSIRDV